MFKPDPCNSDDLISRGGGGALILFGLPFLGFGVFAWVMVLVGNMQQDGTAPRVALALFGTVFATVGGSIMFGRKRSVLNRKRHALECTYSLIIPLKRTSTSLEGATTVTLDREVRSSGKNSTVVYPVRLAGSKTPVVLEEPQNYQHARKSAELVASFMSMPLRDSSSGEEVIREPDHLDESLGQRLHRLGETIEIPEPPGEMATHLRHKGHTIRLDIPPPGFNPAMGAMLAAGLAFPLFVLLVFLGPILQQEMPWQAKLGMVAFIGLFFVLMPLLVVGGKLLGMTKASTIVIVSATELRVERRGLFGVKAETMDARKLEELDLPDDPAGNPQIPQLLAAFGRKGIMARSDDATIEFANHLPHEEKVYLAAIIRQALAG